MAGKLNSEERTLALKIDCLDNILWWYRSIEKKDEALYLQGWHHNRFYPDFIVKTKKGNYVAVEYKGEALLTNIDTDYKKELGERMLKLKVSIDWYLLPKNVLILKTISAIPYNSSNIYQRITGARIHGGKTTRT